MLVCDKRPMYEALMAMNFCHEWNDKHRVPLPGEDAKQLKRVRIAMTARLINMFLDTAEHMMQVGIYSRDTFEKISTSMKRLIYEIADVFKTGEFTDEDFGYEVTEYGAECWKDKVEPIEVFAINFFSVQDLNNGIIQN